MPHPPRGLRRNSPCVPPASRSPSPEVSFHPARNRGKRPASGAAAQAVSCKHLFATPGTMCYTEGSVAAPERRRVRSARCGAAEDGEPMDAKFIVNLSGRDYPLYAGILAEAHERGLQAIETELIQIPSSDNDYTAIVKAVVRMKDGSVFEDFGDSNPRNTNARIATALIRMASTRA